MALLVPALVALTVTVGTNRVHGLQNFVETVSGDAHRSRTLKQLFDASKHATPEAAALAERWRALAPFLKAGYEMPGYPTARGMGQSVDKILLAAGTRAATIDALHPVAASTLPAAQAGEYLAVLKAFAPVYDALVWGPTHAQLERHAKEVRKTLERNGVPRLADQAKAFYGASWPAELPYPITLYPMPGKSGHSMAETIHGVGSGGVFAATKDATETTGMLFHELCHALYGAQTAARQNEVEGWFTSSASPMARLAYQQIDEALATALGNGWVGKGAGSWYNDALVDRYAKAIYPLAERYVAAGKPMDAAFAAEAVAVYEKTFPDALDRVDALLKEVIVTTESGFEARSVGKILREHFKIPSMYRTSPLASDDTAALIREKPVTVVAVLGPADQSALGALAERFAGVRARREELAAATYDYVFTDRDDGGRTLVLIRATGDEALARAAAELKKRGRVDRDAPLFKL